MTGGGCVPLIPYLISRSKGEALNPKHTHTLSRSLTNVRTYSQVHLYTLPSCWKNCCGSCYSYVRSFQHNSHQYEHSVSLSFIFIFFFLLHFYKHA